MPAQMGGSVGVFVPMATLNPQAAAPFAPAAPPPPPADPAIPYYIVDTTTAPRLPPPPVLSPQLVGQATLVPGYRVVYENPQASTTSTSTVGGEGGLAPTLGHTVVIPHAAPPQEGIVVAGVEHPPSLIPAATAGTISAAQDDSTRRLVMPASTLTPQPLPPPPLRHTVVVGLPNTTTVLPIHVQGNSNSPPFA